MLVGVMPQTVDCILFHLHITIVEYWYKLSEMHNLSVLTILC
jgi:hypothetical protein